SAATIVNTQSGAAANSLANTPIPLITPARPTRPCHTAIATSGPIRYISGSEVYESKSEYSEPDPSAEIQLAATAAGADSPTSRQKCPTASAAAAFASTAYAFHFTRDGPGSGSSATATRMRKQNMLWQC